MRTFACYKPECGHVIAMTSATEAQYRRTHADFRCPAGHVQGFYGENEQEATIRRLREQLVDRDETIAYYREIIEEQRQEMRSLRARLGWRNHWLNGSREQVAA